MLAVINVSYFPAAYFSQWWIYDPAGLGIPTDFVNVWAAGRLVLDGHPAQAYDWDIQKQVEVALLGQDLPAISPGITRRRSCSLRPCWRIFPTRSRSSAGARSSFLPYLAMMRAIVGRNFGFLLAVGFPMVFNNTLVGQNGFLTAALIGGTLYLMPVRPVLAGICLGLLSYKPQYGLLFPLVLIAASQWTVFFTAATVTLAMAVGIVARLRHRELAGVLPLDADVLAGLPHRGPGALVEDAEPVRAGALPSAAAKRWPGIFHWVLAGSVAAGLALMWRSRVRYSVKAAALATGTLLTTPYLFMYDMMVLAIPVAFLVRMGLSSGFRAYELPALACALAMIMGFILTGMPLGFGATLIVAALVLRRASPWRRPEPAPSMVSAAT